MYCIVLHLGMRDFREVLSQCLRKQELCGSALHGCQGKEGSHGDAKGSDM